MPSTPGTVGRRIQAVLPRHLHDRLKLRAAERMESTSSLVCHAVRVYLDMLDLVETSRTLERQKLQQL